MADSFLFVHSEDAGKELLYSLVISAIRCGVNPVEYLTDVLARIDITSDADLPEFLPHRWKPTKARSNRKGAALRRVIARDGRDLPFRSAPVRLRRRAFELVTDPSYLR